MAKTKGKTQETATASTGQPKATDGRIPTVARLAWRQAREVWMSEGDVAGRLRKIGRIVGAAATMLDEQR